MRIIAGKYKRTPLKTLEGEDITRPTRDMVKEALFSSIMIYSDTTLLDLFSGSGAIGLEALSRGAKDVTFNDVNKDAVRIIKENLKKVREEREVLNLDYKLCLAKMEGRHFDYIYVDPPYAFKEYENISQADYDSAVNAIKTINTSITNLGANYGEEEIKSALSSNPLDSGDFSSTLTKLASNLDMVKSKIQEQYSLIESNKDYDKIPSDCNHKDSCPFIATLVQNQKIGYTLNIVRVVLQYHAARKHLFDLLNKIRLKFVL